MHSKYIKSRNDIDSSRSINFIHDLHIGLNFRSVILVTIKILFQIIFHVIMSIKKDVADSSIFIQDVDPLGPDRRIKN